MEAPDHISNALVVMAAAAYFIDLRQMAWAVTNMDAKSVSAWFIRWRMKASWSVRCVVTIKLFSGKITIRPGLMVNHYGCAGALGGDCLRKPLTAS